jgi:hypothetical protein
MLLILIILSIIGLVKGFKMKKSIIDILIYNYKIKKDLSLYFLLLS